MPRVKPIHALCIRRGVPLGHPDFAKHLLFAIVSLAGNDDDPMPYASAVFSRVPGPGIFAYNTMIRGYAESPRPLHALDVHRLMLAAAVPPDGHTYPFLLKACAKLLSLCDGERVHCRAVRDGNGTSLFVRNTLVHLYSVCGVLEIAHKMFDEIPQRSLISWNSVLNGYAINGKPNEVLTLLREMMMMLNHKDAHVEPDGFTMVTWSACFVPALRWAHWVLAAGLMCTLLSVASTLTPMLGMPSLTYMLSVGASHKLTRCLMKWTIGLLYHGLH